MEETYMKWEQPKNTLFEPDLKKEQSENIG